MKLLINYANETFRHSQQRNSATALAVAGFDRVISYGPQHLDGNFRSQHRGILSAARGNGYWLWKPYLVAQSLSLLSAGDYLFYSDSGSHFLEPLNPLFELAATSSHDMVCFELEHPEQHWTKRDAFLLLGCDQPAYRQSRQRLSGWILWRKSSWTVHFVQEWLAAMTDPRLATDQPNGLGQPNYRGFREHRHDQSVLSLLSKRYGVPAHRDPSQFGNAFRDQYQNSPYGQLIASTRNRKRAPLTTRLARKSQRLVQRITSLWSETFAAPAAA